MNKSWYFWLQQELKKCKCPSVRSKIVQSSQSQVFLRLLGCQVLAYSRSLKYFVLLASANTPQGEWLSYRREVRNEILDQQREVSFQEYNVMAACYLHRHIAFQSERVFWVRMTAVDSCWISLKFFKMTNDFWSSWICDSLFHTGWRIVEIWWRATDGPITSN